MKYRTKLYLALIATAIISSLIGLSIAYIQVRQLVLSELHTNVTSIAADSTLVLNSKLLAEVQLTQDSNSVAYQTLQHQLQQIRDTNRRKDVFVKYAYILYPLNHNLTKFVYLVDAEDKTSKDFSNIGEAADEAASAHLSEHLNQVYSPDGFIWDSYGRWLTAYAPIYDGQGKYLATVGINLYASHAMLKVNKLLLYGLWSFLATLGVALLGGWYLSRKQAESLLQLHTGVKAIGGGDLNYTLAVQSRDEFGDLASEINQMAKGLKERERLLMSFTRYVSQHIMESILKSEDQIKLSGERRKITVLFSDIRNFTSFSEKYPAEQVVSMLNEYFSGMVEIIFRNQGILDKFLGDGIMVEFGVPLDDPEQELNAVKTAMEMRTELARLCAKWESEGLPAIDIGIGIHTGEAVIGNIGSEKRIEYTAIGDAVNVAARIEQLTKELKTPVLISETTIVAIRDKFDFKDFGAQTIRGRVETINVYGIN